MSDAENPSRVRAEKLHDAISSVLIENADHAADRGLLVNWIMVAEVVGDDGESYFRSVYAPDSSAWQRIGLLDYGKACEVAVVNAFYSRRRYSESESEDDDDDVD